MVSEELPQGPGGDPENNTIRGRLGTHGSLLCNPPPPAQFFPMPPSMAPAVPAEPPDGCAHSPRSAVLPWHYVGSVSTGVLTHVQWQIL